MTMKYAQDCKNEIKFSDKGDLLLAKNQLEKTVKDLTEEIERLSIVNKQLIDDLSTRSFYNKYYEVLEELNQLKSEQELLIDFKFNCRNLDRSSMPLVTINDNQSNNLFTQESQIQYQLKAKTTNFANISSSPLKAVAFQKLKPPGNKNFESISKDKPDIKENRSFSMHRLVYPTIDKELSSDNEIQDFNEYDNFESISHENKQQKISMVNIQESK